jgi:hypothetical protein
VKRTRHLLAVCAIVAAVAAVATAMALGHKPIIFHAFAERDCACGDFHDKVTGLVVRNPFRDLAPERAADSFLASLRANKCYVGNELCDYALPEHRVSDWRLVNRDDAGDSATLYFRLTKYGNLDQRYSLTGEGMIRLRKDTTGWRVLSYGSYF